MTNYAEQLFCLNSAAIKSALDKVLNESSVSIQKTDLEVATDALIETHLRQVDFKIRSAAERMAEFYLIFYMLENDIRAFVSDILQERFGESWWDAAVPEDVVKYAKINKHKESREGLPPRSVRQIDYITFGHLGEIIKQNWDIFAGLFPNCEIDRLEKVIARLNIARGPIAHCGYVPEDEVVRLKLAIRDWYSLAE